MLQALLTAARPLLQPAFSAWGVPVTWLEIVAFGLSLWMVACEMRVRVLAWPLAIATSLLYALLFADSRLYGEASLQLFFVAMAVWGWWQWWRGRGADGQALVAHRLTPWATGAVVLATVVGWPLFGWLLHRLTDSDVPFLDALPTVGSVVGTLLLGRKFIENWAVWIAVNLVSTALFAYKGLWLTVILYALFAALSWAGWRAWLRIEGRVDAGAAA
jgi:nicotinamide mononucleotide transporter